MNIYNGAPCRRASSNPTFVGQIVVHQIQRRSSSSSCPHRDRSPIAAKDPIIIYRVYWPARPSIDEHRSQVAFDGSHTKCVQYVHTPNPSSFFGSQNLPGDAIDGHTWMTDRDRQRFGLIDLNYRHSIDLGIWATEGGMKRTKWMKEKGRPCEG